jgi:hypothetical protein
MKIVNLAFYIWVGFIIVLLSFKAFTWEHQNKKPRQKFGERVVVTGKIFDRPMDSLTYPKRQWFTYSPLIHKKPRKWGCYE